ncbi:MAG TPA: DUF4097 family beta strand repeat-containing protein [Pseudonocardiaceae bacterium]|nr:DUF4097 family beta strand repeat-containing protein [Pseudonocardiaceae bacterium]
MEHDGTDVSVVRQERFDCPGPADIRVELDGGRLDIALGDDIGGSTDSVDTAGSGHITVQIRPDLAMQPPWNMGVTSLLSWLGGQGAAAPLGELAADAVRQTLIDFTGRRLTVRSPREFPLRTVPLIIQVTAPAGSSISARGGSADLAVTGVAAQLDVATGSGEIRAQQCTGAADVRTGSGDVRMGTVLGRLRVRTGSGLVDVTSVEGAGAGTVRTGSGDVRLGAVKHDMSARTGSGDLTVVDACAGGLELTTGSGQLRIGIHQGVLAELDVSSGSGQARSDLPVSGPPAEGNVALRVRARTGSGDALVTAAPC